MTGPRLYIAPLPPRGWRRVWLILTRRRRLSRRWKPLGLYTPEEHR